MNKNKQEVLSKLPQVNQVLNEDRIQAILTKLNHEFVTWQIQKEIEKLRTTLKQNSVETVTRAQLLDQVVESTLHSIQYLLQPRLRRVINATGIILHTGLGRAPLSQEARENLIKISEGYCNLELDLEKGKRGDRVKHVEDLLCYLTGAEAACVVNNNAAAVLITLNTLCNGKEVIISRGQLIEIGGSFRLPEVMAKSGAKMVEVGTTNKTHLSDYENAITENTGLLFVAHPSNYRVLGFTAAVPIKELVKLGQKYHIPVAFDLGGGVLVDLRRFRLPYEPVVRENVELGVDVISFSGDKVLGGPQSGIIVGKKKHIQAIKSNPLMRAIRCDKLTYAVLEPTLKQYLHEKTLSQKNRVFQMLLEPLENLETRAKKIKNTIEERGLDKNVEIVIEDTYVQIGSGAMPLEELPSKAILIFTKKWPIEEIALKFRCFEPPIVGYVKNDSLFLDLRTVHPDEDEFLIKAIVQIFKR